MMSFLSLWLTPWEPFASLMACMAVAIVLYLRGRRRVRMGPGRQAAFWTGMALIYFFQLTHFDYYAEHEFFLHRLQQLVLHHAAPLLIVLAYPGAALRAGIPLQWRVRVLRPLARSRGMRRVARIALNPALVTIAFIVSILVWLIPSMQTMAMLDWRVYRLMNASMLVSGFAYWWLVLDHRPRARARPAGGPAARWPDHLDTRFDRRSHRRVAGDASLDAAFRQSALPETDRVGTSSNGRRVARHAATGISRRLRALFMAAPMLSSSRVPRRRNADLGSGNNMEKGLSRVGAERCRLPVQSAFRMCALTLV